MALRVLLADESSTIKKAIQLVLSEYGVEVKTVPTGIDVLAVTLTFSPDIIIADILLNKKNGYDVCSELKNNPETKSIPIILMWSSFMQLDEQLFKNAKADASLEKPFESETLKSLIEKLVPRLHDFPLKGLLTHAPLPDFEESDTFVRQKNTFNTLFSPAKLQTYPVNEDTDETGNLVIDEPIRFDSQTNTDVNQKSKLSFKEKLLQKQLQMLASEVPEQVPLPTERPTPLQQPPPPPQKKSAPPTPPQQKTDQQDQWVPAKTHQFVIETENYGEFEEVKVINAPPEDSFGQQSINEQIRNYIKDSPIADYSQQIPLQHNSESKFDEQLAREEIRLMAERICWQLIPEITEKIVREEIAKLLKGIDKNI